jgi:uncharacterized repeat protein (TIGR02543 family)
MKLNRVFRRIHLFPAVVAVICVIYAGHASADYNVTISNSASANGAWSAASPDVWTPTATGANVSVADIQARLSAGTPVVISTTGVVVENGDLTVNGPVSWSTSTSLTLTAQRNVTIAASITATGTTAGLVLTPGVSGSYILNSTVTLSGTTPTLSIAGNSYTVINDVTALQNMANNLAGRYALGSNIDASATLTWSAGAGFVPVGTDAARFTGTFEGLNHTINGLYVYLPSTNNVGLFGYTGTGSIIKNVGLLSGNVTGSQNVGGLVGLNNSGPIDNVYYSGTVNGTGGGYSGVGGLVGQEPGFGIINNCYSAGAVTGTGGGYGIGGLVGLGGASTISNSYSTATVNGSANDVGGLVGNTYNGGGISNSYSSGPVTGGGSSIGALVGWNNAFSISNSYSSSSVNGSTGALIGNNNGGTISNSSLLSTTQMKTLASFPGWDFFTTWWINEGVTYPQLRSLLSVPAGYSSTGLVSLWRAENNAFDSFGNNNGTAQGSVTYSAGKNGQAFNFDGSSYVDLGNDSSLKMSSEVTITAWIKTTFPGSWHTVLSDHGPGNDNGKILRFNGSEIQFLLGVDGSTTVRYTFDLSASNIWQHVAATFDGSVMKLYINGQLVNSQANSRTIAQNPNHLLIGKSGFGEYFVGAIDEVAIYNRALTITEIISMYEATATNVNPPWSPTTFLLNPVSNAQLSSAYESNSVTMSSISMATKISISAGKYSIFSSGGTSWSAWTSAAGTISSGDQVKVMLISSALASTPTTATLTIGGVSGAYTVTTTATPVASGLSQNSLISLWRAENNALDSIGNNHGTLYGGTGFTTGHIGQGFNFDGIDDYVKIPANGNLAFGTGDFTVEFWVKSATNDDHHRPLISNRRDISPSGTYNMWSIEIYKTANQVEFHDGVDIKLTATNLLVNTSWNHVAVTRSGSTLKMFINGVASGSTTITNDFSEANDIYIGRDILYGTNDLGGKSFQGAIDEVAFYNRAIAVNEVAQAAGIVPTQFNFDPVVGAQTSTAYETAATSVAGNTNVSPVSISGGKYAISSTGGSTWGAWTDSAGVINPGDKVKVMQVSSPNTGITTIATLTIGGVSADFSVTTSVVSLQLTNGLVSLWRAENNALDSVGSNHGSWDGSSLYAAGKSGQAFLFSTTDHSGIIVPSNNNLNLSSAISLSAWIKPTSTSNLWPSILMRLTDTDAIQYAINISDRNTFSCDINTIGAEGGFIPFNQWSHVACSYDSNFIRLYVNGVQVAVTPRNTPIPSSSKALAIGKYTNSSDRNFDGLIDDVAIYNRALTATEIGYFASTPPRTGVVRAYITNQNSNSISVIDPYTAATSTITGTVDSPDVVTVSPDGTKVYTGSYSGTGSSGINVLDTSTKVLSVLPNTSGYIYWGMAVSPDGKKLFATRKNQNDILVIQLSDNSQTTIGGFLKPAGIVFSPDGSKLYVNDYGNDKVKVVNTADYTSIVEVTAGTFSGPNGIAISPDGNAVFVANEKTGTTISIIDTLNNAVMGSIFAGSTPFSAVAVTPNGKTLYAGYLHSGTVSVLDIASRTEVATVSVGTSAEGISVTPDGSRVIVANAKDNKATIINTAGNTIENTATTGTFPLSLGNFIAAPPAVTNGLVSLWRGEGNAFDVVGGNNGTAAGGVSYKQGVNGSGFGFNGSDGHIRIPDSSAWDFGNKSFAINFWVKFNSLTNTYNSMLDQMYSNRAWSVYYKPGFLGFGYSLSGGLSDAHEVNMPWAPSLNTWYNIAIVRDGNVLKHYVDGSQLGSDYDMTGVTINNSNNELWMGCAHTGDGGNTPDFFTNGLMDEVAIYNRALAPFEVVALYNGSDITPDQFSLAPVIDSQLSTPQTSSITVTDLTAATSISISGNGSYSKGDCSGTFGNTPGTVVNNDSICVKLASSDSYGTTVSTTLTIGGISSTFNVTTVYSVTFDSTGGSSENVQAINLNGMATAPADPTKTGYTFAGWYSEPGLTNLYVFNTAITANITLYAKWTINYYLVSVSIPAGSDTIGIGTIVSNTGGINCSSGSATGCSASLVYGSSVTLSVSATNIDTTFTGWGGDCSGVAPCTMTIDAGKNIVANFGLGPNANGPKAKIGTIGFDSLNDAYGAVVGSATILALDGETAIGPLLMDRNVDIILDGGYNPYFTHVTNLPTVLLGTLKISNGSLRVKNIKIK